MFLHPCLFGGFQDVDRPLHIVHENPRSSRAPKAIIARDMEYIPAISHRLIERVALQQITLNPLERLLLSRRRRRISARTIRQSPGQLIRNMPTDETGSAGKQHTLYSEKSGDVRRDHV